MANKTPIRTVFDASNNASGLAEFQTGETVGTIHGGTGLSSVGTAGQFLKVNSGATALEWATITEENLADNSTTDLSEGSNLYYTDARARLAISATGSLSYNNATGVISFTQGNSDTVSEGSTNLYYTDARVASYLTTNTYATQSYVNVAVANLVDGAPAAFDTLKELSDSLSGVATTDESIALSIALG